MPISVLSYHPVHTSEIGLTMLSIPYRLTAVLSPQAEGKLIKSKYFVLLGIAAWAVPTVAT